MKALMLVVAGVMLVAIATRADERARLEPGVPGPLQVYETTGRTSDCVVVRNVRSTEVLDGETILFHMTGRRTWMNRLPRRCPGLAFERAFAYQVRTSQLCSVDTIQVLRRPMMRLEASCGLGEFVELRLRPEFEDERGDDVDD